MRLASILLFCLLPLGAAAQDSVALVIGMGDYANAQDLDGPRADARAVGAALDAQGFAVTKLIDTPGEALKDAISTFAFQAETADAAVIYYAGHRLSAGGQNYLIPVDGPLAPASALRNEGVALPMLMRAAGRARKIRMVILDSCHAVPLQTAMPLTPPEPRDGTLVLTSGRAGACDSGAEGPGVFAAALTDAFATPEVEIGVMLDRLRADLRSRSGGDLAPRRFGRLAATPYFLASDAAAQADLPRDRRSAWGGLSDAQAMDLFALARRGDTRALLATAYLRLDPESPRHDPAGAAEDLQRAARTGAAEAHFQLAQLYEEGRGLERDQARALALYKEAAARGHAAALNDLGFIYLQGELGLAPDPERALDYFRRAADRRHPAAMFNFAAMIDDGKIAGRGAPDAALYLYRALRGGDATLLSLMTEEPDLFNSETRKALQRKLADKGFYEGPIDGDYGSGTQAAIKAAYGGAAPVPEAEDGAATAAAPEVGDPTESAQSGPEAEAEAGQSGLPEDDRAPADPEATGGVSEDPAEPELSDAGEEEAAPKVVVPDATPEPGADQDVTPVLRPRQAPRQ